MKESKVWSPAWHMQDVEIKSTKNLHQGHYTVLMHTLRYKKFSGEWSPFIEREQVQISDSAAAVLYDPKTEHLVMVEQVRCGPLGDKNMEPWLLEIVAGYIEKGETPVQTIKREAKEEANIEIQRLIPVHQYYTSPGGLTEKTWIYCGIVDAKNVGGVHGVDDEHEDIKVHSLKFADVMQRLDGGLVTSSSTLISLLWLKMNRDQLLELDYL